MQNIEVAVRGIARTCMTERRRRGYRASKRRQGIGPTVRSGQAKGKTMSAEGAAQGRRPINRNGFIYDNCAGAAPSALNNCGGIIPALRPGLFCAGASRLDARNRLWPDPDRSWRESATQRLTANANFAAVEQGEGNGTYGISNAEYRSGIRHSAVRYSLRGARKFGRGSGPMNVAGPFKARNRRNE